MFEMLRFKKAQLGIIEAKFLFYGLIIGLVVGILLVILSAKGVIPLGFLKTMACGTAK